MPRRKTMKTKLKEVPEKVGEVAEAAQARASLDPSPKPSVPFFVSTVGDAIFWGNPGPGTIVYAQTIEQALLHAREAFNDKALTVIRVAFGEMVTYNAKR